MTTSRVGRQHGDTDALFTLIDFEETRPADALDCGHLVHDTDHYDACLQRTCPICHLTERNGYAIWMEHNPYSWSSERAQCAQQGWMWERVASCLGCTGWTFGIWPCRNAACSFSSSVVLADPELWMQHPTYETWWYPHPWIEPTHEQ